MKNVEKKSGKYLEMSSETPYLCTRFERETPPEAAKTGSEKFLKNLKKRFADSEKVLTFAPASVERPARVIQKRF
ncbi:hypothetical protein [uncultured Alistipes sp.]|uniref:hypothetical protein n=1 Tax=uncultured Alistipes sp. TaxID=538949 RepID=UPI0025E87878|nr:hypothetical protein [uncultured Alistipes sp.]